MKISVFAKAVIRGWGGLHNAFFRARGGRGFGNDNVLLLTAIGRKSGRAVTVPLIFAREGDRLYVVASFGGNDEPPGWYRNLSANPDVSVEVGGTHGSYRARSLSAEEARPIWPKLLAIWPAYATYQKKTKRLIPIVALTPT